MTPTLFYPAFLNHSCIYNFMRPDTYVYKTDISYTYPSAVIITLARPSPAFAIFSATQPITTMLSLILILSSLLAPPQSALPQSASPHDDIRTVLLAQKDAWNNGDIPLFMNGYKNSDSIRFVSSKGINRGYKQLLERYQSRYPTKANMGKLDFTDLEITLLSEKSAVVVGKWQLFRDEAGGGNVGGYFTLIVEKTGAGWKIILDHTS
jgi:ketosteroid isomerase-like protein